LRWYAISSKNIKETTDNIDFWFEERFMDEAWEQGLAKITQFVGNHPEISINCNSISIPETIRPEFYRLFKQVSEQMLNSEYPLLLEESLLLSQKYVEIERKISRTRCNPNDRKRSSQQETLTRKNTLWYKLFHWRQLSKFKLHCITVDSHLDAFLHEPLTAMTRLLFDPIFAFLQSNSDPHKFKDTVDGKIKGEFCSLYQRGYRRWVILHLIRLMQPDALYKVMTPETSAKVFAKLEACNEEIKVNVPSPRRTDILDLRYARKMHALSNVDMLIHSKSMRKYAGIKTMFEAAAHTAVITRQKRPYCLSNRLMRRLKTNRY
jgi:hypothetical protein